MFSPFGARRPEDPRSGGKAPRARRRAASASPYARPENSQPPSPPPAGNPRWFSGIVSGAGRLLSSVFRSDSGESSSSSYSSDADGSSDEDVNDDACTAEFHELDEPGGSSKSFMGHGEGSQLITQRSERRLGIEKLLLQETFLRDEADRLIKIIQSRVVDSVEGGNLAVQMELPDKTLHSDATLMGTWRSLNRGSKLSEGLIYPAKHLNDLSPGTSILHDYSPTLCNKAIMEAKKWLEKKKMESTSKAELDCGPCTLNTDSLQYRMEDELGSPVDIAKSYMRERPPWQSPILSSIGFKTPPIGMHIFEDETPHAISVDSFSKALKRGYLATDCDDTRSVRPKSMENPPDSTIFQPVESSIRMLEHEALQTADERNMTVTGTNQDSSSLSAIEKLKPIDASATIPEKLAVEDSCPEVVLNSPDERDVQANSLNSLPSPEMPKLVDSSPSVAARLAVDDGCPEAMSSAHNGKTFEIIHSTNDEVNAETDKINETCNLASADFIPIPEDDVNEVGSNHELLTQTVLAPEKESGLECLSSVSDCPDMGQPGAEKDFSLGCESTDMFIVDASQDTEVTPPLERLAKNVSVPDEFASQKTSANHNDVRDSVELLNVEPELASEAAKSPSSSISNRPSNEPKIHASDVHVDPSATEIRRDDRTSHPELLLSFEEKNNPVDARLVDGKDQEEREAVSASGVTANGDLPLQPGSSSNPSIISLKENHHSPTSSNGRSAAVMPAEACMLSTDASVDVPVPVERRTSRVLRKPQNGTTMKSIERMLAENSPNSRHGRGRKVAAKSRRGRGRGK